jgi:Protein of unknown function (DUF2846)
MKKILTLSIIMLLANVVYGQEFTLKSTSPDSATVIFYRGGQLWRALVNFTIRANGVELCRLSNKRYMVYKTTPQKCTFTNVAGGLSIPDKEKLEIDLEGGKMYFVQCDVKSGFITDRMEMTEVTESTAKRKLAGTLPDNCMKK